MSKVTDLHRKWTKDRKYRRAYGVLEPEFARARDGIQVGPFEKYRGIGTPGIPAGRAAVIKHFRELRGHDDLD